MKKEDIDYYKRKIKELSLLGLDNVKIDKNISILKNIKKIYDKKLKQQAKIKRDFIKKLYNCQNTSRNNQSFKYDGLDIKYEYQRYDMKIKQKDFMKIFYDLDINNYKYFLTNCGMSAIFTAFYSLSKHGFNIEYKNNIYIETQRFLDEYINTNKDNKKKCVLLDTLSFKHLDDVLDDKLIDNYDLIIIDSTVYTPSELKGLINRILDKNKNLILIKSHTKMDMLGIEWSPVGSVCIISNDKKFVDEIELEFRIVLSIIGGYAYPNSIPLYWSNKDFVEVTENRSKVIKKNGELVYKKLKEALPNIEIIKPPHNMFILIKPNVFIDYETLEKDLHKYTEETKYKGLINYADSFGLDVLGINGYFENMAADTEVIRISLTDYPYEVCSLIIDEFIVWLKKYLERKKNEKSSVVI